MGPVMEARAEKLWQRKHVLAVRHWGEHVRIGPFPVCEHAFLVAARTQAAGFTGKGQQIVVPALLT